MNVQNMTSSKGNTVPNQFIIVDDKGTIYFQSYQTIIAKKEQGIITLDNQWDYSRTTSKYLYQFLDSNRKGIENHIKAGIYKLDNLN